MCSKALRWSSTHLLRLETKLVDFPSATVYVWCSNLIFTICIHVVGGLPLVVGCKMWLEEPLMYAVVVRALKVHVNLYRLITCTCTTLRFSCLYLCMRLWVSPLITRTNNYVTYIVAMQPYFSWLWQFGRLLCVATMSSLAQLRVRDGYREAEAM